MQRITSTQRAAPPPRRLLRPLGGELQLALEKRKLQSPPIAGAPLDGSPRQSSPIETLRPWDTARRRGRPWTRPVEPPLYAPPRSGATPSSASRRPWRSRRSPGFSVPRVARGGDLRRRGRACEIRGMRRKSRSVRLSQGGNNRDEALLCVPGHTDRLLMSPLVASGSGSGPLERRPTTPLGSHPYDDQGLHAGLCLGRRSGAETRTAHAGRRS